MKKFNQKVNSILKESLRTWTRQFLNAKLVSKKTPTIEEVKNALLNLTGMKSWDEFVAEERPGDCDLVAKAVTVMFPKLKFISVKIYFTQQAKDKMEYNDDPEWFTCIHYLNKLGEKYIDFSKYTNTYEDVYVLDGVDDINSFEYSQEALKYIKEEQEEDPKLGLTLR